MYNLIRPKNLYRYCEQKWAQRSLTQGQFRLRPASNYSAYAADDARFDDELRSGETISSRNATITHVESGETIRPTYNVTRSAQSFTDYFVISFSNHWRDELFDDFNGDACFIVDDVHEFSRRLHTAISYKLRADWAGADAPVAYSQRHPLGVTFEKSMTYALQAEHRFAWIPRHNLPPNTLEPYVVDCGTMIDIARVVNREGREIR